MPRPLAGPHGTERASQSITSLQYPFNIVYFSARLNMAYSEPQSGRIPIRTNLTVDDINGRKYFKKPSRRLGWALNLAEKGVVSR